MKSGSIIIHNPHSSLLIPGSYRKNIVLSDDELQLELLKMTDLYIDEIFAFPSVQIHQNLLSRLVMDPERYRSDADEPMAKYGMGLAYTRTSDGSVLRELTVADRECILTELYDPYHASFTEKVDQILEKHDSCLIIDAHSFPSSPLPYEEDQLAERPDICLGYEPDHLNQRILNLAEKYFKDNHLTVAHNSPFAGSIVPKKHHNKDNRVQSLMIEINRALYMDEQSGKKMDNFWKTRELIDGLFDCLISFE